MCKKIPERTIKLVSAAAFIFFGFLGSYQIGYQKLQMSSGEIAAVMTGLMLLTAIAAYYLMKGNKIDDDINGIEPISKN